MTTNETTSSLDALTSLSKRRGFIFQSSEIYGGINGFWDYGPLGVELKRNIKQAWWDDMVRNREDVVGLDCSIIMNPRVWEASGHVGGFSDPMLTCRQCRRHFRADHMDDLIAQSDWIASLAEAGDADEQGMLTLERGKLERWIRKRGRKQAKGMALVKDAETHLDAVARTIGEAPRALRDVLVVLGMPGLPEDSDPMPCPFCGGDLTAPRQFNLMFKTHIGAMEDHSAAAYLRPETAQGIFCNYRNVLDSYRIRPPFGIAQVGKSFRNEINPRNYTFRSREFEQMEIEFFCHPDEADTWYTYWRDLRYNWYVKLGLESSKLHLRDHDPDELAHYARACADVEYDFPFGTSELEGIANRTDYDLTKHQEHSGKDMRYFDDQTRERFIPFVIEPSGGVDRAALAFLTEAYREDEAPNDKGEMQKRTVMKLHPRLAPTKAAIFPLVKKHGMPEAATAIYEACKKAGVTTFYDEKGAIGRRYRRQDEAGTPYCITVDGDTVSDGTVTVRDRDTLAQERIPADDVPAFIAKSLQCE
jgi:glycyl-tRNA synthetase